MGPLISGPLVLRLMMTFGGGSSWPGSAISPRPCEMPTITTRTGSGVSPQSSASTSVTPPPRLTLWSLRPASSVPSASQLSQTTSWTDPVGDVLLWERGVATAKSITWKPGRLSCRFRTLAANFLCGDSKCSALAITWLRYWRRRMAGDGTGSLIVFAVGQPAPSAPLAFRGVGGTLKVIETVRTGTRAWLTTGSCDQDSGLWGLILIISYDVASLVLLGHPLGFGLPARASWSWEAEQRGLRMPSEVQACESPSALTFRLAASSISPPRQSRQWCWIGSEQDCYGAYGSPFLRRAIEEEVVDPSQRLTDEHDDKAWCGSLFGSFAVASRMQFPLSLKTQGGVGCGHIVSYKPPYVALRAMPSTSISAPLGRRTSAPHAFSRPLTSLRWLIDALAGFLTRSWLAVWWWRTVGAGKATSPAPTLPVSAGRRRGLSVGAALLAAGSVWRSSRFTRSGSGTCPEHPSPGTASASVERWKPRKSRRGPLPTGSPSKDRRGSVGPAPASQRTSTRTPPAGQCRPDLDPVRTSSQAVATAKRRKLSETRYSTVLTGREDVDGLLRRKTVTLTTRTLYERVGGEFLREHQLTPQSPVADIDAALDRALVQLYLSGESATESNVLYYAVRFLVCRTNAELRLSYRSRQGHARTQRTKHVEPETWEGTVLMCLALLRGAVGRASQLEAALASVGFLLSFDCYGRGTDIIKALKEELRPPMGAPAGLAAKSWTLTLYPSTHLRESKSRRQDLTKIIAGTNPKREWLTGLCSALKKTPTSSSLLLGLREARYVYLFHHGRKLGNLPASHPHRLRHGGASADALLPGISDLTLQDRGSWATAKSVQIYRQPARYLRQLALLSHSQIALAAVAPTEISRRILEALRRR